MVSLRTDVSGRGIRVWIDFGMAGQPVAGEVAFLGSAAEGLDVFAVRRSDRDAVDGQIFVYEFSPRQIHSSEPTFLRHMGVVDLPGPDSEIDHPPMEGKDLIVKNVQFLRWAQ